MSQNGFIFPNFRDETSKKIFELPPPPRDVVITTTRHPEHTHSEWHSFFCQWRIMAFLQTSLAPPGMGQFSGHLTRKLCFSRNKGPGNGDDDERFRQRQQTNRLTRCLSEPRDPRISHLYRRHVFFAHHTLSHISQVALGLKLETVFLPFFAHSFHDSCCAPLPIGASRFPHKFSRLLVRILDLKKGLLIQETRLKCLRVLGTGTLQEMNISHLGKRKIIFKMDFSGGYVSSLEGNAF